jgi:phosphate transport system permease protein
MNKRAAPAAPEHAPTDWKAAAMQKRIRRRYAAERRFKLFGMLAVILSAAFLAFLIFTMVANGARGFLRSEVALTLDFPAMGFAIDRSHLGTPGADLALSGAGLQDKVETLASTPAGYSLASDSAWITVRDAIKARPDMLNGKTVIWVPASTQIEMGARGQGPAAADAEKLRRAGQLRTGFNWGFFSESNSNDPVAVGIWGALKGSLLTMVVTFLIAFPVGVLSAIYLEEYAPRNRWTDLIEVSINNLAAVPSIIFGLLGLAVFLGTWEIGGRTFGPLFPRSAAVVGGLTLALMIMPVIVIASRNAIKAVPPSIRDAALGIGASRIQVVFHHVLPLAMPGILTGTIIGMARALGETAPLLLIGMVSFVPGVPHAIDQPVGALPSLIYIWENASERAFHERTAAAIMVLLAFMIVMNAAAIILRRRFERRW